MEYTKLGNTDIEVVEGVRRLHELRQGRNHARLDS